MQYDWKIKVAQICDLDRWFDFLRNVIHDFYDIDLINDQHHKEFLIKNIKRKTAIYIENENKIIGGMVYSTNQNQITWLAVNPEYRRKGIGTALVKYMFNELSDRKEYKVNTFIDGEWQSKVSHPFYKSLGFEPKEISYDNMENNANHPMMIFIKKIEK
jgi:GNAT superfamily N-acetyltransferase